VLGEEVVADLRAATNGGWAIGNDRFKEEIAAKLWRRVKPLPPSRPPKARQRRPTGSSLRKPTLTPIIT
jgi:hypothetical protein